MGTKNLVLFSLVLFSLFNYSEQKQMLELANSVWKGDGELNQQLIYKFEKDSGFVMIKKGSPNASAAKVDEYGNYVPQSAYYEIRFVDDQICIDIYYKESPEIRAKGIIKVINEYEIVIGMNMAGAGPRPESLEKAADHIKLKRIKEY